MNAVDNPLLILVDGSSFLYRAFHALPSLTNSAGMPTGAVYGVINMLRRLLKTHDAAHMAVIFDASGKTFRHELYPDYKATRPRMPDELRQQIAPLHALIQALGLPLIVTEGVEADDVIGTLARQAESAGKTVLIVTGDKDLAQLVTPNVTLLNTMTEEHLDCSGVEKKFGVRPDQIVDYLSLIGDKVDNVPGVEKVGPKTAVKWLSTYHTVDNLLAHAESIGGKVGENLRAARETLPLAQQLVTINCEVALTHTPESLHRQPEDRVRCRELYTELDFKTWLKESMAEAPEESRPSSAPADRDYQIITTAAALSQWLDKMAASPVVCVDTETTSLDPLTAELVGLSFAITPGEAVYIPVGHDAEVAPSQLSKAEVLAQLKPWLEDDAQTKIGQNLKYDAHVFANEGITLRGIYFDTMLASYVYNSSAGRHDMDSLAERCLQQGTIHYESIAGKGKHQLTFNQIPLEVAAPYAAEDADITLQLFHYFQPKLAEEPMLQAIFTDLEMPLLPVLWRMERLGVNVDAAALAAQSEALSQQLAALTERCYELAGETFNLDSPKQLQRILYEKMRLPVLQKTPKGQPSTAEPVLQSLALDYPLPALLMEYRQLTKLKNTYTDRLPEQVNAKTQRVHTSYQQAVAGTGRLSSSQPNLQNIPIRTAAGRKVRQAFVARPEHQIVAADYSQIELRIMAHLSQDAGLLRAFNQNADIHRATAAEVFSVALDQVTAEQRRHAKAINFGLIYGMSAFGLARQLKLPRAEAQAYMDQYFDRYPGVKAYMDTTRAQARDQGYVETLFGRRLYLPEINAKNTQRQRAAERAAINAPMQGTAADIIKRAMIAVDAWLQASDLPIYLCMQVHDELVFEVHHTALEVAAAKIDVLMTQAAALTVPLIVDIGVGDNWDDAH